MEASEGLEYRQQLGRPALHPDSDVIIVICVTLERQLPSLGLGFLIRRMRGLFYKVSEAPLALLTL